MIGGVSFLLVTFWLWEPSLIPFWRVGDPLKKIVFFWRSSKNPIMVVGSKINPMEVWGVFLNPRVSDHFLMIISMRYVIFKRLGNPIKIIVQSNSKFGSIPKPQSFSWIFYDWSSKVVGDDVFESHVKTHSSGYGSQVKTQWWGSGSLSKPHGSPW